MNKKRHIIRCVQRVLAAVVLFICPNNPSFALEKSLLNLEDMRALEIQHMDSSELFSPSEELKTLDLNRDQKRILSVYLFLSWGGNLQNRAKPEEIDRILGWAKDHHRLTEWSMIRTSLTYWGSGGGNLSSLMEKLIAEIRTLNDPQGLAFALVYHSYYLLDNRKNEEAYKILVEANELLKTVAQPSLIIFEQAKAAISLALGYQEKFEQAKSAHLELDAFYEKHGIRSQRAFNLYNLGFIHRNKGGSENLAVAQEYFQKSIKLAESVHSDGIVASNYYALSLVANQQKLHKQAVNYALKAVATFHRIGDGGWRSHALKQLAQAYKEDKQFDKALETADKAAIAFPKDSRTNLNELKFLRYEIYKDMQEWQKAMQQLEQYTGEFRKLAAEKEKEEYQKASVNLGLQFEEERNKRNALELDKTRTELLYLKFAVMGFVIFAGVLVYAVQQRRLVRKQQEVLSLELRLKDEQEARNAMAAKAAHHLNNPLQALMGVSESVAAEAKNIWTRLEGMFPSPKDRTRDIQAVIDSFQKSFQSIEANNMIAVKSLKRANTISNELRIVSGIHGVKLERLSLADFWLRLCEEISDDMSLQSRKIVIPLSEDVNGLEVWVEPITFIRSIFYLLKEILESLPADESCHLSFSNSPGDADHMMASILIASNALQNPNPAIQWRELRFCQHLLARHHIVVDVQSLEGSIQIAMRLQLATPTPQQPTLNVAA